MISIILTGGRGIRLRPFTNTINKCLLKIYNKTILDYVVNNALELYRDNLIEDIVIVTGYDSENIIEHLRTKYSFSFKFTKQEWDTCLGAIYSARQYIKDYFLLMLGDEILIKPKLKVMLRSYIHDGILGYNFTSNKESIKKTYSIELKGNFVTRVIEKPNYVLNNLQGTGHCILPKEYFDFIKYVKPKNIGDFVTVVQYMIDSNYKFTIFKVCDKYFNINTFDDYYEATSYITERLT